MGNCVAVQKKTNQNGDQKSDQKDETKRSIQVKPIVIKTSNDGYQLGSGFVNTQTLVEPETEKAVSPVKEELVIWGMGNQNQKDYEQLQSEPERQQSVEIYYEDPESPSVVDSPSKIKQALSVPSEASFHSAIQEICPDTLPFDTLIALGIDPYKSKIRATIDGRPQTFQAQKPKGDKMDIVEVLSDDKSSAAPASQSSQEWLVKPPVIKQVIDSQKIKQKIRETQLVIEVKPKIVKKVWVFNPIGYTDDIRGTEGHKDGGFALTDAAIIAKYRGAMKHLVGEVGRSIFSGKFNLTSIPMPIKAMTPHSVLECQANVGRINAYWFQLAAQVQDPVQKMKYTVAGAISYVYSSHHWNKPLNPIIGETYQACGEDGSKWYLEQVQHKPPTSSFLCEGAYKAYRFHGYDQFAAHAHMNSIDLEVKGYRQIDYLEAKQSIRWNGLSDAIKNIIFGTLAHQLVGRVDWNFKNCQDQNLHNISAFIQCGKVKRKPQDHYEGEITVNGSCVAKIRGSYLGFLEIDGVRYWDIRSEKASHQEIFGLPFETDKRYEKTQDTLLASDSRHRMDSKTLKEGDEPQAQTHKDNYEQAQRAECKMRTEAKTRREEGGAKLIKLYKDVGDNTKLARW